MTNGQFGALLACALGVPSLGWAETARFVPADPANYTDRDSRSVRRIVIHTIEGSAASGIAWFQDPAARVSAHYVVSHAGRVTQMVADEDVAWHAGSTAWNRDSIGIECEGYAARDDWTDAQYLALAELVGDLCARYAIPVDRAHLVAHSEISDRKGDPGVHFDWDLLLRMVGAGAVGAASDDARHVVQRGETLGEIADRWETAVAALAARNGLADPDRLVVGQELQVPRPAREVLEVTAAALNVRAGAWGDVLGQAQRGQRVVARGRRDGWVELDWRGTSGWASAGYLRRGSATVRFVARPAAAREQPSGAGDARAWLEPSQAYAELGRNGAWVLLQIDQRALWVAASDLD